MTKIKIIITTIFIIAITILVADNKKLREEKSIAENNVNVLTDTIRHYKVSDSLNAIQVNELILTKQKYESYRAEDAALIKKLKYDKAKEIIKTVTETKTEILTRFDTIYSDSAKHFCYDDKWTCVNGLVYNDSVKLNIKNNEELIIVESIQRKKFLFFKLPVKIFGYKNKQVSVVSKNPHTQITSTEYISIK